MKTTFLSLMAIAIIGLTIMTSCRKYEDGPGFSLRTKKARLTGEWKMTHVKENGESVSLDGISIRIEYKKNDTFIQTVSFDDETESIAGTWEFSNKKDKIYFTYDEDKSYTESFNITRLTNKELWVYNEYNDGNGYAKDEMKFEKQ